MIALENPHRVRTTRRTNNSLLLEQARSICDLGAGVAHDVINGLACIDSELQLMAHRAILPADASKSLASMRGIAMHLINLARGLGMAVADPKAGSASAQTRLDQWWSAFSTLLGAKFRRIVNIHADCQPMLPDLAIASSELTQIVLNLVGNAADAIVERKRIERQTRPLDDTIQGEVRIVAARDADPRGAAMVRLTVSDNGNGMTPEVLAQARQPYFTTKSQGGGGVGLALVERLVNGAGGAMDIQSTPMQGTVVSVVLPVVGE